MQTRQFVKAYTPKSVSSGASSLLGASRSRSTQETASRRLALTEKTASEKLGLESKKLKMSKEKNFMDTAIKIHNKKLDIISKENLKRAEYGEAQIPLPKFNDTLRDEFGIDNTQETTSAPGASSMLNTPVNQAVDKTSGIRNAMGGGSQGLLNSLTGQGGRLDPQNRAIIEQLLGQIPEPKPLVNDRLPKIDDLISALDEYDNPKDAIDEIMAMEQELQQSGLDVADIPEAERFVDAFKSKFGDTATQTLIEQISKNRGQ